MSEREAAVLKRIQATLDRHRAWWIKTCPPAQPVGTPDIIGCHIGLMFAVEVKRPGEKPTKIQLIRMEEIRDAGGRVCSTSDEADVEVMLEEIRVEAGRLRA